MLFKNSRFWRRTGTTPPEPDARIPLDEAPETDRDRLQRYMTIRQISRDLTRDMMKHVPRRILMRGARDLNMVRRGTIVFDAEEDTTYLMDRCFYDLRWQGKNLVEHFVDSDDYEALTDTQKTVAQGMTTAYYSLFEIQGANPLNATIDLCDLLDDNSLTMHDQNMSRTAVRGLLLATRINSIQGIQLSTGVACPFLPEQKERLLERLKANSPARKRTPAGGRRANYSAHFYREYKRDGAVEYTTRSQRE